MGFDNGAPPIALDDFQGTEAAGLNAGGALRAVDAAVALYDRSTPHDAESKASYRDGLTACGNVDAPEGTDGYAAAAAYATGHVHAYAAVDLVLEKRACRTGSCAGRVCAVAAQHRGRARACNLNDAEPW